MPAQILEKQKCSTCGTIDKTGLINGMCTNCFDMYLDIGKGFAKDQKRKLSVRRKKALV